MRLWREKGANMTRALILLGVSESTNKHVSVSSEYMYTYMVSASQASEFS